MSDEYGPGGVNGNDSVHGLAAVPAQRSAESPPAPDGASATSAPVDSDTLPPAASPATPSGGRGKGRLLLVVAIVVASLVVFGGIAGLVVYDKATAIDRSTPVISADALLNAVAVSGDESRAGLYTCSRWSASDAFAQIKALIDPEAHATWDSFALVSQSGSNAVLDVRMRFRYPGEVAPSGEKVWRLNLVDEQGWRVCSVSERE